MPLGFAMLHSVKYILYALGTYKKKNPFSHLLLTICVSSSML